jgi:hypothetical protein
MRRASLNASAASRIAPRANATWAMLPKFMLSVNASPDVARVDAPSRAKRSARSMSPRR